ncbi:outer membrane beta-barrel protein [Marinobacter shengliensis]
MDSKQGAGMPRSRILAIGFLLVCSGAATTAQGNSEVTGGLDTRFTDNARKTSSGETSDMETRAYIRAGYRTDPGRCNADFTGTLGYSLWHDNSFDDEAFGEMDFTGDCELANRFYWDVSNNLREVNQDATQSNTPDNRTRKNVFSTGPRYLLRVNDTNWLNLSARYENVEFSEPEESDSERYIGSVAWNHIVSQTLTAGVSTSYSRTEYDTDAEVDVKSARLTFSNVWATTRLSGAIGVSEIETRFGSTTQSSDGLIGELDLTRTITPSLDWYLRGARELTDRTSSFDIRFGEFEFNLRDSISVETTTLSTGINQRYSDRSSLTVDVYASQADYLESPEREDKSGLNARYSRPLTELASGYASIGYDYTKFQSDQADDRTLRLEAGTEYQATRDFNLVAKVGHERKVSDVPTREYDENWVLVGVEYRFR